MDKSDLTMLVTHMCEIQRQQFQAAQELVLGIVALQRMMDERFPGFEKECHARIQDLRRGELGQRLARDKAAFEQVTQQVKASLLS